MKRILYAGLILLAGLGGGVALNGWNAAVVDAVVGVTAGYVLGILVWAWLEEKK